MKAEALRRGGARGRPPEGAYETRQDGTRTPKYERTHGSSRARIEALTQTVDEKTATLLSLRMP